MLPSHHRWNLIEICLQMEHPDYQRRYPDISLPEKGSDGFNALYNPSGIVWCLNTIHHTIPEGVHPRAGPGRIGVKGPARGRTRQGMYQSSIDRGPSPSTASINRQWSIDRGPCRQGVEKLEFAARAAETEFGKDLAAARRAFPMVSRCCFDGV